MEFLAFFLVFTQLLVVIMQGYIGIHWHTLAHLGTDLGVGFVNLSGDGWWLEIGGRIYLFAFLFSLS